jgi:hypothetical protein
VFILYAALLLYYNFHLSKSIIVHDLNFYPYIKHALTPEVIAKYMSHVCKGMVVRFDLPGLFALNFTLTSTLSKENVTRRNLFLTNR